MTPSDFYKNVRLAHAALESSGPAAFFYYVKPLSGDLSKALLNDIQALENRYTYLLKFISSSTSDFSADADFQAIEAEARNLLTRLYSTADELDTSSPKSAQLKYQHLRPEENFESLVSDYLSELERLRTDSRAITDTALRAPLERLAEDIFKRLWATNPISTDDERLIETLIGDDSLPAHDRVLIVAALGLGAELYSYEKRVELLRIAAADPYRPVAIAAQIWLLAIMAMVYRTQYSVPIVFVPEFIEKFKLNFPEIEPIYHALVRSMADAPTIDTGRLMSLGRKMQQKPLDMPDMSPDDYDAMKEFVEAQRNGDDVFAATVGRMRHFPFFSHVANWFTPFHPDHSALAQIVDGEGAAIAEMITKIPGLTDGDKYALLLSMAQLPAVMRNQAVEAMVDQFRSVADTDEFRDAMAETAPSDKILAANAVNNIRRFEKGFIDAARYPVADAFKDTAKMAAAILPKDGVNFDEEFKRIKNLIRNKRYADAIEIVDVLPHGIDIDDVELALDIAHAFGNEGEYFRQDTLLSTLYEEYPDNRDVLLAVARFDLMQGIVDFGADEINEYLHNNQPDAEILQILAKYYVKDGKLDEAIETLHNADYIADSKDIRQELAWVLTMAGDYTAADEIFSRLSAEESSALLLMRHGIELWLAHKRPDAIESIINSRRLLTDDSDGQFMRSLQTAAAEIGNSPSLSLMIEAVRNRLLPHAANPEEIFDIDESSIRTNEFPF